MRLLELPQQILDWLVAVEITAGHARALLPIGDEDVQMRIARQIMDDKWSVRAVESHVNELLQAEQDEETGKKVVNVSRQKRKTIAPHIEAMQQEIQFSGVGVKYSGFPVTRFVATIPIFFSGCRIKMFS